MNQRLYRIVMARYLNNLRTVYRGGWTLPDFEAVLEPFGIKLNEDGKTIIPASFMASFTEIIGHFIRSNPSIDSLFEVGECDYIDEPDFNLKPIRERFEEEEMDQKILQVLAQRTIY